MFLVPILEITGLKTVAMQHSIETGYMHLAVSIQCWRKGGRRFSTGYQSSEDG